MAYLRIETAAPRHRKFLAAGPAACWLWVCGLAYCQDGLTDGFIPFEALEHLGVRGARGLKVKLLASGLWEEVAGGWYVHDYLHWNRDATTIRAIQQERREAGARGGTAKQSAKQTASKRLASDQNTFYPTATATTTAAVTATPAAAVTAPTTPHTGGVSFSPIAGRGNAHRSHAECGRVCLPAFLYTEFVQRRGGADPDHVIRDWAHETLKSWAVRDEEPGEPIAFWRARYAERWPSVATKPEKPLIRDWRPAAERAQ